MDPNLERQREGDGDADAQTWHLQEEMQEREPDLWWCNEKGGIWPFSSRFRGKRTNTWRKVTALRAPRAAAPFVQQGRPEGQEAPSREAEHSGVAQPAPPPPAVRVDAQAPLLSAGSLLCRAHQLSVPILQGRNEAEAEAQAAGGRGCRLTGGVESWHLPATAPGESLLPHSGNDPLEVRQSVWF